MSFRLWTIFYIFALLAAAMATFGIFGIYLCGIVLLVHLYAHKTRKVYAAAVVLLFLLLLHVVVISAVVNAQNIARESRDIGRSYWNMTAIASAIIKYEAVNGTLPPAFIADADGKPLHSWRVLILPYLGENALYGQYAFDEPWDGPRNRQLWDQMPECFQAPIGGLQQSCTAYLAVVGEDTAWPGAKGVATEQIGDDPGSTILLLEATCKEIKWTEPRDLTKEEAIKLLTTEPLIGHRHLRERFLSYTHGRAWNFISFVSGRVYQEAQLRDPDVANAMLTINGGETVPDGLDETFYRPAEQKTVPRWGKIWGLSIFLLLSVSPFVATWRRT